MSPNTSRRIRMVVAVIVGLAALLMITVVPLVAFDLVNPIVIKQQARIEKFTAEGNPSAPLLTLTTWLVSFFFPFWGTLSFIAGITLLVILSSLFQGKEWARGLALFCLAIPSIGGAYMIVPWMNFVGSVEGGFPPAVIVMMIGLIPYFSLLLAERGDFVQKGVDLLVFLMLGVAAAESFANGHAAFRILYGHPKRPLFADGISITYFGWLGLWIGAALAVASIFLLGSRKKAGIYSGLISGLVIMAVSGATHYVRHATNDYLYGSLMGLSIVVMLLIPIIRERLLNSYATKKEEAQVVLRARTAKG